MPDFTSALYLGLRHASASLRPWARLTTGAPAALVEPPGAARIAAALASLVGLQRATMSRSTLHAFWDLFGDDGARPARVLVDAAAYPIARWGAERAAARGTAVETFRHHDPASLLHLLRRPGAARAAWIITDGFCTGCGRLAPLAQYLAAARETGGRLVVDDTQALGVLGAGAGDASPFGRGGGGALRAGRVSGPGVLLVASLAKAFGAPVAVVAGTRADVERFEHASETRVHASPPSAADLAAAARALAVNARRGDALRLGLARLVWRLRAGLRGIGLAPGPSTFPVQRVASAEVSPAALHSRLARAGVGAVLRRSPCTRAAEVVLLLTAAQAPRCVDVALDAIERALREGGEVRRAPRRAPAEHAWSRR